MDTILIPFVLNFLNYEDKTQPVLQRFKLRSRS
jgi:hypothetical protein